MVPFVQEATPAAPLASERDKFNINEVNILCSSLVWCVCVCIPALHTWLGIMMDRDEIKTHSILCTLSYSHYLPW